MNQFADWSARLAQRARLLHGLETGSWALLLALGVTLIGLLTEVFFGRLFSPAIWIGANLLAAMGGFLQGWLRPLKLSELLYQADRRIGWGEKLITLYELKAERSEFLQFIERDWEKLVARHPVAFERALPLEGYVQRRWGGALALGLFCFALVSYQGFLPSAPVSQTVKPKSEALNSPSPVALLPPPTLSGKIPTWREKIAQARAALAQTPDDRRTRAALEQLQTEITEAQDRLLPTPPSGKNPAEPTPPASKTPQGSDATVTDDPGGLPPPAGQNSANDKLEQTMRDLRAIQGKAQALSLEELQKLLDELRAQNPEARSLLEGPTESAETSEEFSRQLEEALKNLEERQSLQQQLSELQREIQSALAQAQPPGSAQADQPPAPGRGESHGPSSGKAPAGGESEGPRDPQGTAQPSGGKGTAPLDPQAERDLPDLSGLREQIRQIPVTGSQEEQLQLLFEIFQTGLPIDSQSPAREKLTQIDYQRVETLLDALVVPPELRETVRKYFITLAQRSP